MKMKMKMKKERKTTAEEGDDDESGEGGRGKGREREKERERERKRERKHRHGPPTLVLLREPLSRSQSVACAKVQAGAFKALASLAPAKKNLLDGQTLWSVFQEASNETEKKKNAWHVSWSSQAVLEMAAFDAHARQASADEPSGARLFTGFWVESWHCAHDHAAQFELGRELALSQRRFPLLPEVTIEWARVWRAWRPRGAPAGV